MSLLGASSSALMPLRAAIQFLSNFLTGSPVNQKYIWEELIIDRSNTIGNLSQQATGLWGDDMLIANIAMLIHNATIASPERRESLLTSTSGKVIMKSLVAWVKNAGGDPAQMKSFYWMYALWFWGPGSNDVNK